ncbi:MAG: FkbM family methyltransferase, partial [Hyphomicrobiales bacterium]|nr:FkbM family methyltransferase [Hyphomicrobiales bacterium]
LDALIAAHGAPAFAKIDVEGFEADVLAGLSRRLPALSFEFTTIQRDVAHRCLDRLAALGNYRFDVSLGESHELAGAWVSRDEIAARIAALPHEANSGDVYCVLLA